MFKPLADCIQLDGLADCGTCSVFLDGPLLSRVDSEIAYGELLSLVDKLLVLLLAEVMETLPALIGRVASWLIFTGGRTDDPLL